MSAAPLEPASVPVPSARAVDAQSLYTAHSQLVQRYCLRRLRNREDAEDAVQTTFMHAVRALRRGDLPASETAWLLTIARNVCHDRWAASRRQHDFEVARDPGALAELAASVEGGQGEAAALREALVRLPDQQRRALVLREWRGLSSREIASDLQTTESAVDALLFRSRKAMTRALGAERDTQQRMRAFDVGSIAMALKSLLGGASGAKLAALAVVGGTALVAAGTSVRDVSPAAAPQVVASLPTFEEVVRPRFVAAVEATRSAAGEAGTREVREQRPRASGAGGAAAEDATRGDVSTVEDPPMTPASTSDALADAGADAVSTVEDAIATLPAPPDIPDLSRAVPSVGDPSALPDVSLP